MTDYRIKAFVTDIDGSITDSQRKISLEAIKALRYLEKIGIPVMLASGNVLPIAYGLSSFIGITGPVIAENGGVVYYKREVKYLGDRKKCDDAFEELKKHLPVRKIFSDRWRKAEVAIEPDVDLTEVRRIIEPFGLYAESTGFAIHMFQSHLSKFAGVSEACKILGVDVSEVAAFGDSENDLEMIRSCGFGLVPENAQKELKEQADYISQRPDGLGLVEALKWLGICNQK
jgi:phosphoglycolate phosphatase (TIGR01487 family)